MADRRDEAWQLVEHASSGDRARIGKVRLRSQTGFTLIEVLIVVALLAILVGVAAVGIGQLRKNALIRVCGEDRATIETAAQASSSVKTLGGFEPISDLIASGFLRGRGDVASAFLDPNPTTGVTLVNPAGKYGSVKTECDALPAVNG